MSTTRCQRHEVLLTLDHVDADRGARAVLRDVDARIHNLVRSDVAAQGQVVAVLGPSGAGKTTLLRLIAGLDAPARGQVLIGADQRRARPGLVGVVHQRCPLFEHRTVAGNLRLAAARAPGCRDRAAAVGAALTSFGLVDRAEAWPAQLSGGERQRVAIAQQFLCGHTFVVLDEPFAGLDPRSRAHACDAITDVAARAAHNTLIVVTHDLRDAVKVADTVWLLGRDDPATPVSRIVATYDLIERGVAWVPGREQTAAFAEVVRELEARFASL